MRERLPLFPLGLVALPSELVPLHIFEERYKTMMARCLEHEEEFGIVWLADDGLREVGCACEVAEVLEKARGDVDSRLLSTTGYVLDTLRIALWALLGYATLEEAIITAVNLGGDADTQGAVTGALGGALYGDGAIPLRWLQTLDGGDELRELADRLLAAAEHRRLVV